MTIDLKQGPKVPRIFTYEMHQDDPSKCTSAKMRKFGLARPIRKEQISRESIVLNPSADLVILPEDRTNVVQHGIVVIDCSWNKADDVFGTRFKGEQRKLPALLAGNPTNYSKIASLSSLEAVAGALYIMNFKIEAQRLLSLYKWGDTFLSLNKDLLEDYSNAKTKDDMVSVEKAYFPQIH
ncbi:MAG: DUF367 family protein [Nitrososphaerales archaeon]